MTPTPTLDLPTSLNEVDAEWIGRALSVRFPGTTVQDARIGTVINGMATKAQYTLAYDESAGSVGLPKSLWLKSGFEAHSERSAELYGAEVGFFRDIAPKLGGTLPRTYFEAIDERSGNGVLLMEDLAERRVTFGHPTSPLPVEVVAQLLEVQAAYHTFLARKPSSLTLPWLKVGGAIHSVDVGGEYMDFWPVASQQPRWQFVPAALDDPERIRRGLRAMLALDAPVDSWLVHGDPHLGNVFFDGNRDVGFLDWQTVMRGAWSFDVSYFIIQSLTVADRRAHEVELLKHYLEHMEANGADIGFDEAWKLYRQHAMWTFMTVLCPVQRQPEPVCLAHAERSCAALVDLDTLNSLGA